MCMFRKYQEKMLANPSYITKIPLANIPIIMSISSTTKGTSGISAEHFPIWLPHFSFASNSLFSISPLALSPRSLYVIKLTLKF